MSTPLNLTVEKEGDRSDRPEVSAELATKHRAAVARVVYLGQDRLDLGTVMLGNHLIAAWSRIQPRIALRSGEAELYAGLQWNF